MANYVDGFVVAVPRRKLPEYKKLARLAGKIWMEYGALEYVEAIQDDVKPGKVTSFPQAVKLKRGEVVVFCYIVCKSRAHRDRVLKQVMGDPRLNIKPEDLPCDAKRMIWGGFKQMVAY